MYIFSVSRLYTPLRQNPPSIAERHVLSLSLSLVHVRDDRPYTDTRPRLDSMYRACCLYATTRGRFRAIDLPHDRVYLHKPRRDAPRREKLSREFHLSSNRSFSFFFLLFFFLAKNGVLRSWRRRRRQKIKKRNIWKRNERAINISRQSTTSNLHALHVGIDYVIRLCIRTHVIVKPYLSSTTARCVS